MLDNQIGSMKILQKLEAAQNRLGDAVLDQNKMLLRNQHASLRQKILDWVSPRYLGKQMAAQGARVEGTGRWLLEDARFVTWRDGPDADPVLWCYGPQGSGKTVLM
jgi:hypothetical protein